MSGHMVTHIGTRNRPKVCWRVGCHNPAVRAINARFYCADHSPALRGEITADHIREAYEMMLRPRWSLGGIAQALRVKPAALDQALWRHLGSR